MNNIDDDFLENPEDVTPGKTDAPADKHEEQEQIFLRGINGGGEWKTPDGKLHKLHPFSYHHRVAAEALGCRIFKLNQDEIEALPITGYYSGIGADAILVTWLCLRPGSEALACIRQPQLAFDRAFAWGEKNHVEPGNPEFEAALTFMGIEFGNLQKAKGDLKPADGRKTTKGKRPGKR